MTPGKVILLSALTTVGGAYLFRKAGKHVPGFNN